MDRRATGGLLVAAILVLGAFSTLGQTTWTVDDDPGADFTSIQDAVNSAASGDTIQVAAGTYVEQATVAAGKNLTFVGEGRDVVTWIAPAGGACLVGNMAGYTGAMSYEVSGFTFDCRSEAAAAYGAGVKIYRAHDGPLTLSIHDNRFVEDRASGDGSHWATSIFACHNREASRDVSGVAPVQIYNNLDETWGGMTMSNSQAYDVFDNTFDGCSDAIYVGHGCPDAAGETFGDHHIYGNTFKNASDLLHPGGLTPAIDWQYYGGGLGTHLASLIEHNLFESNDTALRFVMDSDMTYPLLSVTGNVFVGSTTHIIAEGAYASTIDASGNWWGTNDPVAVAALVGSNVDFSPMLDTGTDGDPGTAGWQPDLSAVTVHTLGEQLGAVGRIQEGVNLVDAGGTVTAVAGSYVGAVIDHEITIQGDPAGGTIINDGVHYGGGHPTPETAFLLNAGADGTTIQDIDVLNDASTGFFFAVFSRGVDDVTVKDLTIYDTVQGISNWGGSGWFVLDNDIIGTVASGGGGIGIYIGATQGQETCSNNLVQGNVIGSDATAPDYSCPGIVLALDLRGGRYDPLTTYDLGGNQIIGNTISDSGAFNGMGIEVGVIVDAGDVPVVLPATLGAIHDTTIRENTVAGEYFGLYLYNIVGTDILRNVISGNTAAGISMWDGSDDNVFRYNSIAGNAYGLYNETGTLVDAALNWWGDATGPSGEGAGSGDAVSTNVIYSPWLGIDPDALSGTVGVQINSPMLIIVAPVGPEPASGYLTKAIEGSNELPYVDTIEVRHGTYDASEPITDGVTIVSETGSASHTFINGPVDIRAGDVLLGRMRQGFTFHGPITVGAGVDASTVHINWNNIYDVVTNAGSGVLDATYNFWGDDGPDTVGSVAVAPILPLTVGTIIGYVDSGMSVSEALLVGSLVADGLSPSEIAEILGLGDAFGFSPEQAQTILREYRSFFVSRALAMCGGDYETFLALLVGYGAPAGGGGSLIGGGAGGAVGPSGLPAFVAGDTLPLVLELVNPITGEVMDGAFVTYTVSLQLEDGSSEIVAVGAMAFDEDLGAFTFDFDTSGLAPGVYDIYLGSDDGRQHHVQVEIL
ncbi:NosD domain-containing protein [Candidatus Bipolaricaulota bacterium]